MNKSNRFQTTQLICLGLLLSVLSACSPSPERMNNKGNQAFEKQDYQLALENYQKARTDLTSKAVPDYNIGNTHYRLEDYNEAENALKQSLSESNEELAQNGYYNMGNTFYRRSQFEAAIEAYKEALRLDPDDMEAKYNLELALQQLEKQQESQDTRPDQDDQSQPTKQQQEQQQAQQQEEKKEEQDQQTDEQHNPQQQDQTQDQQQPQAQQTGELSEEQAKQLLDAASEETRSLQQYLQQIFAAPGSTPEKDW